MSKGKGSEDQEKESRGGFLGGFIDLIEKLGELAEKGEGLSKTTHFNFKDNKTNRNHEGVYGFSIKTCGGKDEVKVEPFGNIHKDKKSGRTIIHEIREPLVDILEEEDYTLVIAEIPGISLENIKLDLVENVLTISAEAGENRYKKEIILPKKYKKENMTISCNNGILNIKCVD
ncbi:MAG: Hsp20/alpha crystallin family protein [Parachlamydiaceae bacterium]